MNKLATLALLTTALSATPAFAGPDATATATYKDIEKTLGFVPTFFKAFPEHGIAAAWGELKSVQLNPATALTGETKELIALAVSAQVPSRPCSYLHTQLAKLNGASAGELKDAIAMAAITRHWSTQLNGMQIDLGEFKQELSRIIAYVKKPTAKGPPPVVGDAASAYKDIEYTFGFVPTFLRRFPEVGIVAAWSELKSVQLNPSTPLSGKQKELIGLAVAAQIPCPYCVAMHTEVAKLHGASDQEIREAVAVASIARHWSTVVNGSLIDEAQFRKEVDQIVANVKKSAKR
jgi:AhpD family alkylhydroperoxidase